MLSLVLLILSIPRANWYKEVGDQKKEILLDFFLLQFYHKLGEKPKKTLKLFGKSSRSILWMRELLNGGGKRHELTEKWIFGLFLFSTIFELYF